MIWLIYKEKEESERINIHFIQYQKWQVLVDGREYIVDSSWSKTVFFFRFAGMDVKQLDLNGSNIENILHDLNHKSSMK